MESWQHEIYLSHWYYMLDEWANNLCIVPLSWRRWMAWWCFCCRSPSHNDPWPKKIDSPTKLPKCVATQIEQELEAPAQSCGNWTVWFGKLNGPVLSRSAVIRGTAVLRWGAPPTAKWCLDGGEAWTTTTLEVVAAGKRSNRQKDRKLEKLGQKYNKSKLYYNWLFYGFNGQWHIFI
jgi:hypothetical protein